MAEKGVGERVLTEDVVVVLKLMLGTVWIALTGSSKRIQSAGQPRQRPTAQTQEFIPRPHENKQAPGVAEAAIQQLTNLSADGCNSAYHTISPLTACGTPGALGLLFTANRPHLKGEAVLADESIVENK